MVNQNSSRVPITLWVGYRQVTGWLWAGRGPYGQVMDLTGRLWTGYRQVMGRLQVGYRQVMGRHGLYGWVTGRLWAGMDFTGRLWTGYRQAMGRLQVGHGPQGQVMGGLQVGHERVMGGLQADYRQDIDLTGNSLAVGDNREIKI